MAYTVGVMLLLLVFVAMPLKYIADREAPSRIISPLHGFLYVVYVLTALVLARERRWSARRTLLVLLGGVVPFLSFWTERRVVRDELSGASRTD